MLNDNIRQIKKLVCSLTPGKSPKTLETVTVETPAFLATSFMFIFIFDPLMKINQIWEMYNVNVYNC